MRSGKAEGIKQGTEQGIQQGIQQGIKQVTLNMLKQKIDIEIISNATGLSIDYIKSIKK